MARLGPIGRINSEACTVFCLYLKVITASSLKTWLSVKQWAIYSTTAPNSHFRSLTVLWGVVSTWCNDNDLSSPSDLWLVVTKEMHVNVTKGFELSLGEAKYTTCTMNSNSLTTVHYQWPFVTTCIFVLGSHLQLFSDTYHTIGWRLNGTFNLG